MGVEFMPFLIPIVAILGWAAVQVSKNLSGGGAEVDDLAMDLAALAGELDDTRAENERLRDRIEALEALVTHEAFDAAGHEARDPLGLDALPDPEDASGETRRRTRS